jgi:hypothetical protein
MPGVCSACKQLKNSITNANESGRKGVTLSLTLVGRRYNN